VAKKFEVTLKKSLIGATKTQLRTAEALNLRKIGQKVVLGDNPANRGQVLKLQHLLSVEVIKA